MNLLNKATPWVVASLLTAASAFGQERSERSSKQDNKCAPCSTPCNFKEMMPGMPGYNAPSRINVCGNWDMYVDGSFVYWQVAQDNMSFAFSNTDSATLQGSFVEPNFGFIPGFKVGGGINFDHDNWNSSAEYTRVHGTDTTTATAPKGGCLFGNTGALSLLSTYNQVFDYASSKFTTNLDFLDWVFGRDYFVGKNLTFHPHVGARGALITQSNSAHLGSHHITGTFVGETAVAGSMDVYSRVRSWGVGARTGLEANWMLGQGVRFFGNGYADMLYTRYKVQNKSVWTAAASGIATPAVTKHIVGAIRTHLDLELGFAWGSYFDDNNWHIDLSAGYGFQVFFNQNMFQRSQSATVLAAVSDATGDMTIQGLTATVRIDF